MKNWRRRAKYWLVENEILTGYNGLWGTERAEELLVSLTKTLEKAYNERKKK
jgi:hypothetical protein